MTRGPRRLSLIDATHVGFLALLVAGTAAGFPRAERPALLLALLAGAALVLCGGIALRGLGAPPAWKRGLALAYPIVVLFLLFEALFSILPGLRAVRFDAELAAIDRALLGTDATIWMQRWIRPWLTETMHLLYFSYFPLPLVTIGLLYARKRFAEVEEAFFTFLACYYPCYVIYAICPAAGPSHWFGDRHTVPLDGLLLTDPIRRLIDFLEPSKVDAFPSVHAAILLTTMLVTWRHSRTLFVWFLPLAAGITVSLVYTRHHYVVDIVAGFSASAACYAAAGPLYRRWRARFAPHFAEVA